MTDKEIAELVQLAKEARKSSYSPYSGYAVGAALMTEENELYCGCNIENAAFGPSVCAERVAFFKAVSEGAKAFKAIAIAGSPKGDVITQFAYPCGVCRQVMMEFCNPDHFLVICVGPDDLTEQYTLSTLLPKGFGSDNLSLQNGS